MVSILTLLETGLQAATWPRRGGQPSTGFNPHSIGDWFTSYKSGAINSAFVLVSILTLLETGLQETKAPEVKDEIDYCFNPHSIGDWFTSPN